MHEKLFLAKHTFSSFHECNSYFRDRFVFYVIFVPESFRACHGVTTCGSEVAHLRLVQMAADDEDELLRKVRSENRSVSFVKGSELVNIDLGDDSYRRDEDSELSQTVCDIEFFTSSTQLTFNDIVLRVLLNYL